MRQAVLQSNVPCKNHQVCTMQWSPKSIVCSFLIINTGGTTTAGNSKASLVNVFKAFAGFGNHTKPTKNSSSPRFDTTLDKSNSVSCYRTAQGSAGKTSKAKDASGGVQLDGFRSVICICIPTLA